MRSMTRCRSGWLCCRLTPPVACFCWKALASQKCQKIFVSCSSTIPSLSFLDAEDEAVQRRRLFPESFVDDVHSCCLAAHSDGASGRLCSLAAHSDGVSARRITIYEYI